LDYGSTCVLRQVEEATSDRGDLPRSTDQRGYHPVPAQKSSELGKPKDRMTEGRGAFSCSTRACSAFERMSSVGSAASVASRLFPEL
jgi:hypothetical protein